MSVINSKILIFNQLGTVIILLFIGKDNDIEINCPSEVKLSNHEEFDSLTDTGANFAQSSTNLGTPFKTGNLSFK